MKKFFEKYHEIPEIFNQIIKLCNIISKKFPSFLRPIIFLIIYLFMLLFILLLLPVIIIVVLLSKKVKNPYKKLWENIELISMTNSKQEALNKLREVYNILYQNFEKLKRMKSVEIKPYGKFSWFEFFDTFETLYIMELEHNNIKEAELLCDNLISKFSKDKKKYTYGDEQLLVFKARLINLKEGKLNAQKFLMEYLDPKKKDSPIKEYLYELREEN